MGLIVLVAFTLVHHNHAMDRDIRDVSLTQKQKLEAIHNLRTIIRERMIAITTMALTEDAFARDDKYQRFLVLGNRFLMVRKTLEQGVVNDEEQDLLQDFRELTREVIPLHEAVIEHILNNRMKAAQKLLFSTSLPAQQRVLAQCDRIIDYYHRHTEQGVDKLLARYFIDHQQALRLIIVTLLIANYSIWRIARDRHTLLGEIDERKLVQAKLEQARNTLEEQVQQRTADLHESIEQLQHNEAQLRHMANHDPLSGLASRSMLNVLKKPLRVNDATIEISSSIGIAPLSGRRHLGRHPLPAGRYGHVSGQGIRQGTLLF